MDVPLKKTERFRAFVIYHGPQTSERLLFSSLCDHAR